MERNNVAVMPIISSRLTFLTASLQVFLNDINEQENIVSFIKEIDNVRMVRQEKEVTNVMRGVNDLVKYASVVLIATLVLVSMFLISNTVRLGIEVRKREINIMKYIVQQICSLDFHLL